VTMNRGKQPGRLKDDSGGLHFIISDPSIKGNSKSQSARVVRSHVGKWTWENVRKGTSRKERRPAIKAPAENAVDGDASTWLDWSDTSDSALASGIIYDSTESSSSPRSMDRWLDDFMAGSSDGSSPSLLLSPRSSIDIDILDPFQSRVSSPIPSGLVSNSNKYCKPLSFPWWCA
jgi:hypothetical protein